MKTLAKLALAAAGICMTPALFGQKEPPATLRSAARCLLIEKQNWLVRTARSPDSITLGYEASRDYAPDQVLYVIAFAKPDGFDGRVFTIFINHGKRGQILSIQNNARFTKGPREEGGIRFTEEALGGVWTHEHLIAAIKQIELEPRYAVSARQLLAGDSQIGCASYVENEPVY